MSIGKKATREIVKETVAPVLEKIAQLNVYDGGRPGDSDEITKLAGGLPVPSYELVQLVTPGFDVAQFLRSGAEVVQFLCGLLEGTEESGRL